MLVEGADAVARAQAQVATRGEADLALPRAGPDRLEVQGVVAGRAREPTEALRCIFWHITARDVVGLEHVSAGLSPQWHDKPSWHSKRWKNSPCSPY